ncbi:hypothetical protein A7U60_g4974 [Sanghuangporus baumii]|uniref:Protein kinase domain-containing protein n=1 Tax=Sanghuangporus baumii TaxID=108892 RepID=A0A9Q5N482_SANBA|nr:hypothetical protein A7U60_g4974 [Sanghuangporus baumii]
MDDLVDYDRVPIPDEYRLHHPIRIQFFRELEENGEFDLSNVERGWVEDYEYLLCHGYQLRPRFHPRWTPTWCGTNLSPVACEDSIAHFVRLIFCPFIRPANHNCQTEKSSSVIDVKRFRDGKIVAVKRTPGLFEAKIACMLSSVDRLQDPMNHCVPIYDYFPDIREQHGGSFIVMPLLRAFNDPPFVYVDEVVDFVRQMLQGLVYLHSQNVAHRDLSDGNIMMEGRALYGEDGFHPSDQDVTAGDITVLACPRTRRDVGFVKYYFTDFGLSSHFDEPKVLRLVVGNRAQDTDVPELSNVIPYDPFPVDVFTLGNVFKRNFLDVRASQSSPSTQQCIDATKKYSNVELLSSLCSEMTKRPPWLRPSAANALSLFYLSLSRYQSRALRWRLHEYGETRFQRITKDFLSMMEEIEYQAKLCGSLFLSFLRIVKVFPAKVSVFLFRGTAGARDCFFRLKMPENQPLLG